MTTGSWSTGSEGSLSVGSIAPTSVAIEFSYVGEFLDPEQSPLTASLYACTGCGSLVTSGTKATHEQWHARVGVFAVRQQ